MSAAEPAGVALERLRWSIDVRGTSRVVDLIPAAIGSSLAVEVDGRALGRLRKPTRQRPWREATFEVDGETVVIALSWHFPVMRTDVFVGGRSARDGRPVEAVRADAPAPLSNYEAWIGDLFRTPFFGSRPRPPRGWQVVVAAALLIWVAVLTVSPFPPPLRVVAALAAVVSAVVLIIAFVWSMLAFGQRVHESLLARPKGGGARVVLWFVAFVGYTLVGVVVVGITMAALGAR
jgi:hypothetical protein